MSGHTESARKVASQRAALTNLRDRCIPTTLGSAARRGHFLWLFSGSFLQVCQILFDHRGITGIAGKLEILSQLSRFVRGIPLRFIDLSKQEVHPRVAIVLIDLRGFQGAFFRFGQSMEIQVCYCVIAIGNSIVCWVKLEGTIAKLKYFTQSWPRTARSAKQRYDGR